MRTIIAGSRDITDYALVQKAVAESGFEITEVVSGGARGVDQLGERWSTENDVPCTRFDADWGLYGKQAGIFRNELMGAYAEALVAIWDGKSRGTQHMIHYARKKKLKVYVLLYPTQKSSDLW